MRIILTGILVVALAAGGTLVYGQGAPAVAKRTGTFSTFTFNKEGGDLLGVEIRIVRSHDGYQAAVQFAEGEPGSLTVVPVTFDGQKLRFEIPMGKDQRDVFEGTVGARALVGRFSRGVGAGDELRLPRKKSYWD